MSANTWTLYLLRNERGALYTGITTDLERRQRQHRGDLSGAARYTRACKSLELVYSCEIGSHSLALKTEMRIKRLPKKTKEQLVSRGLPREALLEQLELAEP